MPYTPSLTRADVTPKHLFLNRRALIAGAAALAATPAFPSPSGTTKRTQAKPTAVHR